MTLPLPVLKHGSCEPLKLTVHGASLVLCGVMGLYNAAAWINRREPHLAINAFVYALGIAWEQRLVAHHLVACRGTGLGKLPPVEIASTAETEVECAA